MLARVQSFLLSGIDALACEVEVAVDQAIENRAPTVVGLPDAAVKESVERVRSAMFNSGYMFPRGHVLVNLAPADVRKEGPAYDLCVAIGVLMCDGILRPEAALAHAKKLGVAGKVTFGARVPQGVATRAGGPAAAAAPDTGDELADLDAALGTGPAHTTEPQVFEPLDPKRYLFAGELALDGRLRPIRGVIAMAALAKSLGLRGVVVPAENAREAAVVPGVDAIGVSTLVEVVGLINGQLETQPHPPLDIASLLVTATAEIDFADVRGQEAVKRAIIVAAAGGHNLLTLCPSGGNGGSGFLSDGGG